MLSINKINSNQAHVKPSFGSSATSKLGEQILNSKPLKYVSDRLEYNKFTMSLSSMLVLLYGATIVPRYLNATDKYDKREIMTRDFLSITSILFGAKALNKVISRAFSKHTGFVLNKLPDGYETMKKFKKVWNHIRPNKGIEVLKSDALEHYYSDIEKFTGGVEGWIKDFVKKEHGDIKKILSKKYIKKYSDGVLGCDISNLSEDQIVEGFIKADNEKKPAMKKFYEFLKPKDNPLVTGAKTKNSLFDFVSTICLVPVFMIWIENHNAKVTRRQKAADDAKKAQASAKAETPQKSNDVKDAYASFLGNKKA